MNFDDSLTVYPIGILRSPFKQKFGTPRQAALNPSVHAEVHFHSDRLQEGALDGIEGFSHLWLVSHLHKNRQGHTRGKVQPPRLMGKKMGLFATRSPHRPCPLGLSLVELVSVDPQKHSIKIKGVDLIEGTPILDIKPYVKDYDYPLSSEHGWVDEIEDEILEVEFSTDDNLISDDDKLMLLQTLSRDLRNLEDKLNPSQDKVNKSLIGNFDVSFIYHKDKVEIVKLEKVSPSIDSAFSSK